MPSTSDFMHLALIHITHELGEIDFSVLLPAAPLLDHVHNSSADKPITTQKATVFTVEFTKKLLKKPGAHQYCAKPEAPPLN